MEVMNVLGFGTMTGVSNLILLPVLTVLNEKKKELIIKLYFSPSLSLNILDYYRQMIADLLANPIGIAYGAAVTYSKIVLRGCAASGTCELGTTHTAMALFVAATDILSVVQTLKQLFENGFDGFFGEDSVCEEIDDIRSEMEEILGIQSEEDDGGFLGIF